MLNIKRPVLPTFTSDEQQKQHNKAIGSEFTTNSECSQQNATPVKKIDKDNIVSGTNCMSGRSLLSGVKPLKNWCHYIFNM